MNFRPPPDGSIITSPASLDAATVLPDSFIGAPMTTEALCTRILASLVADSEIAKFTPTVRQWDGCGATIWMRSARQSR